MHRALKIFLSGGDVAAAAFSPLSLSPTAWYDPSDLSTLWQDSARTTPVAADGDVVGCIDDKSGNGYNWLQATTANKPLYKTAGGLHWLLFDGVDDVLNASPVYANASTDLTGMLTSGQGTLNGGSTHAYGMWQVNATSPTWPGIGSPVYYANGVLINPQTERTHLKTAWATGVGVLAEARNADLAAMTGLGFGTTGWINLNPAARVYGKIIAPEANMSANRAAVLAWMAAKSGVTL